MRKKITNGMLMVGLILTGSSAFSQLPATLINAPSSEQTAETAVPQNTSTTVTESKPSITDLPGFPVFVNTGNAVADDARYEAAKTEWYSENKRLVKKFYRQN